MVLTNISTCKTLATKQTRQIHTALLKGLGGYKGKTKKFSTQKLDNDSNINKPATTYPFSGMPDSNSVTAKDFVERVDGKEGRVYQFKEKEFGNLSFPSVTSILNATMSTDKWFRLNSWKKGLIKAHGVDNYKKIRKQIVDDGSNFHKHLEQALKQLKHLPKDAKERDVDAILPDLSKLTQKNQMFLASVKHVLTDIGNVRLMERPVVHSYLGYSGTIDCAAEYKGELCAIDWKTSSKPKATKSSVGDYLLQITAYAGAINNDPSYPFNVSRCLIVVVYPDGSVANTHWLDTKECEKYWNQWLARLDQYRMQLSDDFSNI